MTKAKVLHVFSLVLLFSWGIPALIGQPLSSGTARIVLVAAIVAIAASAVVQSIEQRVGPRP